VQAVGTRGAALRWGGWRKGLLPLGLLWQRERGEETGCSPSAADEGASCEMGMVTCLETGIYMEWDLFFLSVQLTYEL